MAKIQYFSPPWQGNDKTIGQQHGRGGRVMPASSGASSGTQGVLESVYKQ